MNWHKLLIQDCFIPFNLVSSPAWMSTALVMDFYSNVLQQARRAGSRADAGAGDRGMLINRQGADPGRAARAGHGSQARKKGRANTCAASSRKLNHRGTRRAAPSPRPPFI